MPHGVLEARLLRKFQMQALQEVRSIDQVWQLLHISYAQIVDKSIVIL